MAEECKLEIGKTYEGYEKGKKRLWGRILDQKGDEVIVYSRDNPVGYRVYAHKCSDVLKWIKEGKINVVTRKPSERVKSAKETVLEF